MPVPPSPRELGAFFRPGTLRFKALVAVSLVVLSPAAWVWGSTLLDQGSIALLRTDLTAATSAAVRAATAGTLDGEALAASRRVRIRLLDDQGSLSLDADHDGDPGWFRFLSDPWFGPEGRPDPAVWDDAQPPLSQRPELDQARAEGRASHCEIVETGFLLVCAEVRRVTTPSGKRWLHVQRSSARSQRSLYEDRFQMTQLTLSVLLFAVLVTFWLGTRWVRPIERLRDQALARTVNGVSTEPLTVDRTDELGEVADAFNTLLKAIEQRNQANETFAADLAHELKNPIAAVHTAAEALEGGRPLTEARAARLHRILSDSSQRMGVVVERFLELARAEAGLSDTERTAVDVCVLLSAILQTMRDDGRFSHLVFLLDAANCVELAMAPERMETAFRNLIVNAATFAVSEVEVVVTADIAEVCIEVRDDGPGIEQGDLHRIFDRYFSKRQGGTGLGLPLSKAIFEAHGGSLVAESPPGEGAVFRATLPR